MRLVLVDLLVHLQVFSVHGQADAGRIIACAGEVELLKALWSATGFVTVQHAGRPRVAGKGQPGGGVFVGVYVEE